jgi:hypothetical protein
MCPYQLGAAQPFVNQQPSGHFSLADDTARRHNPTGMRAVLCFLVVLAVAFFACRLQAGDVVSLLPTYHEGGEYGNVSLIPSYPWERNITATIFWVGEKADENGYHIDNLGSAWNTQWEQSYGGLDAPAGRIGYLPGNFVPHENPFYVALPFNDLKYPRLAARWVPWWDPGLPTQTSQCRGRWLEIRTVQGQVCYAQWEDAGPFRCDDAAYVFDPRAQTSPLSTAGLDVSPAVGVLLGLNGHQSVSWRFVDSTQVPDGPWLNQKECVPALEKLSLPSRRSPYPVTAYVRPASSQED